MRPHVFTKTYGLFAFIVFISLLSLVYLRGSLTYGDENIHRYQIEKFINGEYDLHPNLTTIPAYHALLALAGKAFGASSISFFRFINFLISFFALVLFLKTAKILDSESSHLKTLELYMLPILFPFWYLIYTDALSFFMVMGMLYFLFAGSKNSSAFFGIGSYLVRQMNVIWFLFLFVLDYLEEKEKFLWKDFFARVFRNKLFIFGTLLFVVFLVWNRGIAIGDKVQHPANRLYFGNIFVFLIYSFFAFLPLHIANFQRVFSLIKKHREIVFVLGVLYVVILFTQFAHKYNQPEYVFYIHNIFLKLLRESMFWKTIFFIPAVYALLSHITFPLLKKHYSSLYLFSILALAPSWLVDPRYFIVPSALFLLLRKTQARIFEYAQITMYVILSAAVFLGIAQERFFL